MKHFFLITLFTFISYMNVAQTVRTAEEESSLSIDLGNAKADNGDWKGALNDYVNAIGYDSKNAKAYFCSGLARQNLKDYRTAIADFSKAIYFNHSDAASYYGRGICYYMLSNKSKCCFDLSKASELGFNDANQAIQNYCN
ncbi:MAG: tetratricopeptide repeat protein [Bacteroidota bacterium]